MVDKIEMSLDDIIKKNKIGFRRNAGGSGGGARKQANGAGGGGGNRRNTGPKTTQKFRGTANRQIGKPKGRSFGGAPTRKFSRVRKSSHTHTKQTMKREEKEEERDERWNWDEMMAICWNWNSNPYPRRVDPKKWNGKRTPNVWTIPPWTGGGGAHIHTLFPIRARIENTSDWRSHPFVAPHPNDSSHCAPHLKSLLAGRRAGQHSSTWRQICVSFILWLNVSIRLRVVCFDGGHFGANGLFPILLASNLPHTHARAETKEKKKSTRSKHQILELRCSLIASRGCSLKV